MGDPRVVWRYVHKRAKTVHGLDFAAALVSVCGTAPAWWRPEPRWLGSGSDYEREQAATLPRCRRCVRILDSRERARPVLAPAFAEVYDWLRANGVDEWIPEPGQVWAAGGQLTYLAWQWAGRRGWDVNNILVVDGREQTEWRTVPLTAPVTARIRQLAREVGMRLVEARRRVR